MKYLRVCMLLILIPLSTYISCGSLIGAETDSVIQIETEVSDNQGKASEHDEQTLDIWLKYPDLKKQQDAGLAELKTFLIALEPDVFTTRHQTLVQMVESDDALERARAIRAIEALREPASLPFLVAAIENHKYVSSGPQALRGALLQPVISLSKWVYNEYYPAQEIPEKLAPLLPIFIKVLTEVPGDTQPNIRAYCFKAIGVLAGPEWLPLVNDLSGSRHPAVTHWSDWALEQLSKRAEVKDTNKTKPIKPFDAIIDNPKDNFVLYISNQCFAITHVDITVYIDDKKIIDAEFAVKNQHNWIKHEFTLSPGTHKLRVESKKGKAELEKDFEITGKHWAAINFWYYPEVSGGAAPTPRHFSFKIQNEPLRFK